MNSKRDILDLTLERLKGLYRNFNLSSGTLSGIVLKPFWTVVTSTGNCGIAIKFGNVCPTGNNEGLEPEQLRPFIGLDLFEIASRMISINTLRSRSIASAVISCLSQPLMTPDSLSARGFASETGGGEMASMVRTSDVMAIVGYAGIITRFIGKCKEIHAAEMRQREEFQTIIIGNEVQWGPEEIDVHTAEENKEVLGKADIVFITASTFVNGTFIEVASYCKKARLVVMYGPTGSIIPDAIFDSGVDLVSTIAITNPKQFEADMGNVLDGPWGAKDSFTNQTYIKMINPAAVARSI